ncbi:conserved domain protein [Prevotella denticola CRIS 18C-A]|uniref:Conserved domain protein n=1 Tax=Prevotella denticola CRIS 18C-A TaxID=944557 RepID=F0H7A8_9BACT|nr:conserved domain protein [Prevotella denticola CRIS 18C-A]
MGEVCRKQRTSHIVKSNKTKREKSIPDFSRFVYMGWDVF